MSAIVWCFLLSFTCLADHQVAGGFGYELLVTHLENLEERLTNITNTFNAKADANNERLMERLIKSEKSTENRLDNITASIDTMINRLSGFSSSIDSNKYATNELNSKVDTNNQRLIQRLMKLETTGDAILSKQRSTENRLIDITASVDTLSKQSKQILKNHNDLVITSCAVPTVSGVYRLQAPNINVFCRIVDRNSRWLFIQQQTFRDVIDFDRNWYHYRTGFGNIGAYTSFWLGLDAIHEITNSGEYELYIGINNEHDDYRYARYSQFKVASESDGYRLTVGGYSGTAGDMLVNNTKFSTFDKDNDTSDTKNCAKDFNSGWWFTNCRSSNLNGPLNKASNGYGIEWGSWAESAKYSVMMIQRKR